MTSEATERPHIQCFKYRPIPIFISQISYQTLRNLLRDIQYNTDLIFRYCGYDISMTTELLSQFIIIEERTVVS